MGSSDIHRQAIGLKMELKARRDKYDSLLKSKEIKISLSGDSYMLIEDCNDLASEEFIRAAIKRRIANMDREVEKLGKQIKELENQD